MASDPLADEPRQADRVLEQQRAELNRAFEIVEEGRQSHVIWRDHIAACGLSCKRCQEFPSCRTVEYEQDWIDKYDLLRRVLERLR